MLFGILSLDSCNLLQTISKEDVAKARKTIIQIVMATDMAHHGKSVTAFNKIVPVFSFKKQIHREMVSRKLISYFVCL